MSLKRRKVLRLVASSTVVFAAPAQPVSADSEVDPLEEIAGNFFSAMRGAKDKQGTVISCANGFCEAQKEISRETLDAIVESGEMTETGIRRARFGVRVLREYGLTDAVNESMLESGERSVKRYTRYLPLLGSFNNCRTAACAVDEDKPETIERFLYASLAFGMEVALWYYGAPFKMAWRGTRFIANRTFLRLARNGCRACVALAMSEIHWAIRGTVYNLDEMVTKEEFILQEFTRLQRYADETGYEVDIEMTETGLGKYVDGAPEKVDDMGGGASPVVRQRDGFFERFIPDGELQSQRYTEQIFLSSVT